MDTSVCIVGAGISGLAIAAFLAADPTLGAPIDVQVIEAAPRPGGVAWSERIDGRLVETGPASWLSGEPALDRLVRLAGLDDAVLEAHPDAKARYVFRDGQLHRVPSSPPSLVGSKLMGAGAKLRLLGEPFAGRGKPEDDESVADFFRRRLGAGVIDPLVAPMVAGIYGAEPEKLSVQAAFPKLWAMEQQYGSLLMGALKGPKGGPRARLQAMKGGAGTLTRGLAEVLGPRLQLGRSVVSVEPRGDGWRVHTDEGRIDCAVVVLATPAYAQAAVLRGLDAQAARALDEIPYAPIAVATVAWPQGAFPTEPTGFGVLVAASARSEVPVLGTIFVSSTFPDHAPQGEVLLRTMVGGSPDPDGAALDTQALSARVHDAHARMLGAPQGEPLMTHITRQPRAIPQYGRGHLHRVAVARQAQARHPGLYLVGNHLDGPGVRDCARTSHLVAQQVREHLGEVSAAPV